MKYAGIGSRNTPEVVLFEISTIAFEFSKLKWVLRTGGAPGADTAFERGAKLLNGHCEVFLPWKGFNNNDSSLFNIPHEAYEIAERFHPRWHTLKPASKALMARNSQQVLGQFCNDPVDFVLCWTPDGCEDGTKTQKETGGTGQALRIATFFEIPIYNLRNGYHYTLDRIEKHVELDKTNILRNTS